MPCPSARADRVGCIPLHIGAGGERGNLVPELLAFRLTALNFQLDACDFSRSFDHDAMFSWSRRSNIIEKLYALHRIGDRLLSLIHRVGFDLGSLGGFTFIGGSKAFTLGSFVGFLVPFKRCTRLIQRIARFGRVRAFG